MNFMTKADAGLWIAMVKRADERKARKLVSHYDLGIIYAAAIIKDLEEKLKEKHDKKIY